MTDMTTSEVPELEPAKTKTLRDWLPREALSYQGQAFLRHLDQPVVREYGGPHDAMKPWPGTHKSVICWCFLANGRAVGWNENPGVGWAFPLIRHTDT